MTLPLRPVQVPAEGNCPVRGMAKTREQHVQKSSLSNPAGPAQHLPEDPNAGSIQGKTSLRADMDRSLWESPVHPMS